MKVSNFGVARASERAICLPQGAQDGRIKEVEQKSKRQGLATRGRSREDVKSQQAREELYVRPELANKQGDLECELRMEECKKLPSHPPHIVLRFSLFINVFVNS